MEFLVCISKAPDTTTRIAFTEGDTRFNEEGVQFIVNPYDEWYALVRALELVEAGGGKVVIASVGGADVEPILRKALAIGAHEAVRIDADPQDAGQVAAELAAYAGDKGFNAILCGKETIDHNGSAVPAMLAEHLDVVYDFRGYKHGTSKEPSNERENVVNLIISKRRGNQFGDQMDLW